MRPSSSCCAHDVLGIEVQHDVPSQGLDARDQPVEDAQIRYPAQMLDEVESNPANAARVQALEFALRHAVLDAGNAAIAPLARGDRIQCDLHVRAMAAGMDDDGPRDSQLCVQPAQILDRRIGRRVAAVGRVGKFAGRPKDMAMRVAGAGRQRQGR